MSSSSIITIAVIRKNSCYFNDMQKYVLPLLYTEKSKEEREEIKKQINSYIWSVIEPYVTFIQVRVCDLIETVCQYLTMDFPDKKPDTDFFYHTEGSYSFPKKYIEFFHAKPLWNSYEAAQPSNMNNIGCLLSLKHHVIENTCIVIGNVYGDNNQQPTIISSITKEDLLRVIRRRFYFSAMMIDKGNMIKYYYQSPQYLVSKIFNLEPDDKIQTFKNELLGYDLVFYFQYCSKEPINKIATRINGLFQINGKALMLHEMSDGVFSNLSLREAKRLNVLSYGRLYDRRLQQHEIHTVDTVEADEEGKVQEKKSRPYWNRYIIVEGRMKKWNEKGPQCINCDKSLKDSTGKVKGFPCPRCYRVRYCSVKCEKEFDHYHYDECINPQSLASQQN